MRDETINLGVRFVNFKKKYSVAESRLRSLLWPRCGKVLRSVGC